MSAWKLGFVIAVGSMIGVLLAMVIKDALDYAGNVHLQRVADERARKEAWEDSDAIERTTTALSETVGKPGKWVPRLLVRRSEAGVAVCGYLEFEGFSVRVIHPAGSAVRVEPYGKADRQFERLWLERC